MSVPPPAGPPPEPQRQERELRIALQAPKGLRKLAATAGERHIHLHGSEMTLVHPGALLAPLTLPGGLLSLAVVDRGLSTGEHGRFPILHRMVNGHLIPREEGIEGWLWTTKHGSVVPALSDRVDDTPNLALMFVRPLDAADLARWFRPEWVRAVADRSPLGTPSVTGLLAAVEQPTLAETAFREFGVLGDLSDRDVPPTQRRHLPTDKPANPQLRGRGDDARAATSVAPPGMK